jgi:hypothetical protein
MVKNLSMVSMMRNGYVELYMTVVVNKNKLLAESLPGSAFVRQHTGRILCSRGSTKVYDPGISQCRFVTLSTYLSAMLTLREGHTRRRSIVLVVDKRFGWCDVEQDWSGVLNSSG